MSLYYGRSRIQLDNVLKKQCAIFVATNRIIKTIQRIWHFAVLAMLVKVQVKALMGHLFKQDDSSMSFLTFSVSSTGFLHMLNM